jgi:hypothetical protein
MHQCFSSSSDPQNVQIPEEWWNYPPAISAICYHAIEMDALYPQQTIVSIGQSMAWSVHTLGVKRMLKSMPAQTGYIPFSGNFYEYEKIKSSWYDIVGTKTKTFKPLVGAIEYERKKNPRALNPQRRHKFLDLLRAHKLDPQSLVSSFKASGQKTVLAEKTCTGSSLMSFFDLIETVADDQHVGSHFPETVHYHVIATDFYFPGHGASIKNSPQKPKSTITGIMPYRKPYAPELDLVQMFTGNNNGRQSPRLVPYFNVNSFFLSLKKPQNEKTKERILIILDKALHDLLIQETKCEIPQRPKDLIVQYTPH